MNKGNAAIFLIGLSILLTCGTAQAATTYQYTGNVYTDTFDSESPAGIYTTSMSVSGSFTVVAPLNMTTDGDISGAVTAYSFNDGRFTLTDSNSEVLFFDVMVDAIGNIVDWRILVDDIEGATIGETVTSSLTTSFGDDTIALICPDAICSRSTTHFGFDADFAFTDGPGTWSVVPVPAAAWLFASALGLLGWIRRRVNHPCSARSVHARQQGAAGL